MEIVWSVAANADRFSQLQHIALENPPAAVRVDLTIERRINDLADFPNIGRPGRVSGTRELVITGTPFVVVYRLRRARVEILRFLHGAQMFPPGAAPPRRS